MAGLSRMLRNRGAVSGVLLILLGAWGGLVPFIGPYFHYAYTPDTAWHFTLARLWLEILPGAATVLGGALIMASTGRLLAGGGAILAALGGGWFIVGSSVNMLWPHLGVPGVPAGTSVTRVALEELGFFTGLGAVIVFFAALALGRCSVAAFQGAEATAATGDSPAGEGTDSTATSGFPASTAGPPPNSGSLPARTDDTPGGPGYSPPGHAAPTGDGPDGAP
jgi:hypothetical protein